MLFTRELLYNRHRLSHQQINDLLGITKEKDLYTAEKLSDMHKVGEFILLTDKLRQANINFVTLKGPILSHRLYGDPTYRRYKDFDLLFFSQKDTIRAYELMLKNGFLPTNAEIPKTDAKKQAFFKNFYDIPMYDFQKKLSIELHAKLFKFSKVKESTLQHIIESNLTTITLSGRAFSVLNNELELLYLIIHGTLHRFSRLKWLIDIKDYLKKMNIDHQKFKRLVKETNSEKMVSLCGKLLEIYFPELHFFKDYPKPSKSIIYNVQQSIEDENVDDKASFKKFINYMYFTLKIQPDWKTRLSVLYKQLYISNTVNFKNENDLPLVFQFIRVPFNSLSHWIS